MTGSVRDSSRQRPGLLVALGGLGVGTVDLTFAYLFWMSRGVTLPGILQSIAAGWYGKASHSLGATSVVVGALSHYAIATAFVWAYWYAARRMPVLTRKPVPYGALYGLALYALMNFVVLRLSATGMPKFDDVPWVASSVCMHVLLGILCAWFARKAVAAGRP